MCFTFARTVDETCNSHFPDRIAHRAWQKQVPTCRGKCPLAKASHHPQAPGETAGMHQHRSHPARSAGQAGSNLAADPIDRATRLPAPVASGTLPCAGYVEYPFQNKHKFGSISQAVPGISPEKGLKKEPETDG